MVQQDSPFTACKPERVEEADGISAAYERQLKDLKRSYEELYRLGTAEPYTRMGEVG